MTMEAAEPTVAELRAQLEALPGESSSTEDRNLVRLAGHTRIFSKRRRRYGAMTINVHPPSDPYRLDLYDAIGIPQVSDDLFAKLRAERVRIDGRSSSAPVRIVGKLGLWGVGGMPIVIADTVELREPGEPDSPPERKIELVGYVTEVQKDRYFIVSTSDGTINYGEKAMRWTNARVLVEFGNDYAPEPGFIVLRTPGPDELDDRVEAALGKRVRVIGDIDGRAYGDRDGTVMVATDIEVLDAAS